MKKYYISACFLMLIFTMLYANPALAEGGESVTSSQLTTMGDKLAGMINQLEKKQDEIIAALADIRTQLDVLKVRVAVR